MKNCYVYQIVHLPTLKSYIGSRTAKECNPLGIGIKYFSSSNDKDFRLEQKEKPENFSYFVLKEFGENHKEYLKYEMELHEKYNIDENEKFYNRTKASTIGFSMAGKKHSNESKEKMSKSHIGKKLSEEHKDNISKSLKGKSKPWFQNKTLSEEHRDKISKGLTGRPVSKKTKEKISESNTGKKRTKETKKKLSESAYNRKKVKCPYCDKIGDICMMKRWHFSKCKHYISYTELDVVRQFEYFEFVLL